MNRMPRFFGHNKRSSDMDSKHKPKGPKLDRRLAKKNIDYEPSTSSSSSPGQDSSSLRTRSLEFSPLGSRRSFRVQGIDGEFDEICRSLGLSGPDDFAIPAAAWESRKVRSSSDLLPRPPLHQLRSPKVDSDSVRVTVRAGGLSEPAELIERTDVGDLSNELRDGLGFNDIYENKNVLYDSVLLTRNIESSRNGGGIKGVRPPVLAPPPSISLPVLDNSCSTWDILRSFAPDFDEGSSSARRYVSSDDEDNEEIEQREGVNEIRPGVTADLSPSCSFTTSNDDDSSSTTTEPMSNISPNGRFKRIISGWQKGDLLGRGSFGSVYEGIADGGFFFAVKEVSLLDQGDLGRQSIYQLEQEIALLSQFEHENIVQYYGTDKDESNLYIFLELVTKGSLLNLYQKYDLRDSQVSSYTRQILHGLKYLHERDVVHRDIKCANILVDASGSVKLADFGLAKATKLNDVKSCKGTAFWMAPEVVNRKNKNDGYGLPADIWSLGCTVLEMLTHQIPYSDFECICVPN
ncbi:mitogen-activated protein kinase kinase kinase 1-like isoform X2 [Diospyros lotus]|uniref:mitogen-activated protein kinase kinase kinase 1-like isoform X2 n=1 Tax=Diospyros lotus TaxID=55363 RepID=UPI002255D1EE|nr:mitogen-activated protein kinase kinase kinase 1-like isoform X2 [Diospyros lotus]